MLTPIFIITFYILNLFIPNSNHVLMRKFQVLSLRSTDTFLIPDIFIKQPTLFLKMNKF